MEKIKRKLGVFIITYGKLLLIIFGAFCIIRVISKFIANNNYINNTYENELVSKTNELTKLNEEDKKIISKFIEYCNVGNVSEAYNMLSDKCKTEVYYSEDIFKNEYIGKFFRIKIVKYEVDFLNDDTYKVDLTQNMLETGKTDGILTQIFKIEKTELDKKIYIQK